GLSVVTFSLGDYWDRYYRGRPFYHEREQWVHRPVPAHMHPAFAPHAGPPPHRGAGHESHPAETARPRPEQHGPDRERAAPERAPEHQPSERAGRGPAPNEHAAPQRPEARPEERRPEAQRDEHEH